MSRRTREPTKTVEDVAKDVGRYSLEAFEFLHKGLDYTVQKTHGPAMPGLRDVMEWLESHGVDLKDLPDLVSKGKIPQVVLAFFESFEGFDAASQRLNRHVGGEELCWGLRELAIKQWGLMTPLVLRHWGIRSTKDFGEMVFALVENSLLHKQPTDHIEDFDDVYDFTEAFDRSYKISLSERPKAEYDAE
ncbi:MAG: hypothetical protein JXQ75_17995 [Phycisphaerae bacterium]|nr:hypothetical protein [Phycisphaerae bacterium]